MYEKGDTNEQSIMSSPTEVNKESSREANNTLIEIVSRTIARMDELESTMQQMESTIYAIKNS